MKTFLKKLIVMFLVFAALVFCGKQAQAQSLSLTGSWLVDFSLSDNPVPRHLRFDAELPNQGNFLLLNVRSNLVAPAVPTKAMWNQTAATQVRFFGAVEFPIGNCCREAGSLTFTGLFINADAVSGAVVFTIPDAASPGGSRSQEGTFMARRADLPKVHFIAIGQGRRLRRGEIINIEWQVESSAAIVKQEVWLSLNGREAFYYPVTGTLDGNAKNFSWTVPEDIGKTKNAVFLIEVVDGNGNIGKSLRACLKSIRRLVV